MSRYRIIHCLIWNDDKFPFLSDDCKLVFFHLLTTPYSTPFGLYKCSIASLADEMRWHIERYEKAFMEAFREGFVKHDERHLVILIPNFLKYNPPSNPNVLKGWKKIWIEIPECKLKYEWYQILKSLTKGFGKGFNEALWEALPKGPLKGMPIQEQEQEQYHKTYSPNSNEFRLSNFLLSLIKERNPDYKQPNLQVWSKHIDLMIRIDKRPIHEIESIIQSCQQDLFWQNNILSTEKLRKQYDQLKLKLLSVKTQTMPMDSAGRILREI